MVSKIKKIEQRTGLLFTLPAALFVFSFIIYPLISNVFISFYDYNPLRSREMIFRGLENYKSLFVQPTFIYSLFITTSYALVAATFQALAGFFISIFFSMFIIKNESQGVLKWINRGVTSILILPWTIPGISAAVTWRLIFHPMYSPINVILGKQIMWLTNPSLAFFSIIIASVWKSTPYFVFFFIAGIMSIPPAQFEAAKIEGASRWQEIRYVILPNLLPVLIVAFSFRLIDGFTKIFDMVYVLTGGGPGNATKVMPLLIQETGLKFFRFGLSSAMSVVTVLISIFFGVALIRRSKASQ